MAKRMKFSVVGLPHYTIWHLYEPSVDDIRHMEEMEKERKAKEAEEAAKKERQAKIEDQFDTKSSDWEKEKAEVQNLVQKAKNEEKQKEAESKEATKKDAETKEEVPKEKVKQAGEPVKQARDFQDPDEIHEARGSDEKAKVEPKQ
jgi:mannan polymerase II complex ANP1 subunit